MATSLTLKQLRERRRLVHAEMGEDPMPRVAAEIAKVTEWLEPPETFLLEDHALLFKLQVENNIKLARYNRFMDRLIDKEGVKRMADDAAKALEIIFEGFPDRMAPELAALTDPKQVRMRLREALVETLQQFGREWNPMPAIFGAEMHQSLTDTKVVAGVLSTPSE